MLTISTMAKVKQKVAEEFSEAKRIRQWRYDALRELGLNIRDAMTLMETPDIVHTATELVENGCPPRLIATLLGE